MITKFKVQRFKTLESVELELGNVNVFIGANGSGKSNLLEAVATIAAAAFGRVDHESLVRRGCRPGSMLRSLLQQVPRSDAISLRAENNASSYAIELNSPELPRGWELQHERWMLGGQTLVDRGRNPESGDPQVGLAALK